MKTKNLLFTFLLFTATCTVVSAEKLISENFSSTDWETELKKLNDGPDGPITNDTNPVAYSTPQIASGATNGSYTNLNSVDLYFYKYRLAGAIEVLPGELPCALGESYSHINNGVAVAFRFGNSATGCMEFPEIASAGIMTLHIRNGNSTNATTLGLEKYNNETKTWDAVYQFPLIANGTLTSVRDEILTYDVNSTTPIKLRLINNVATSKKFINLYQVDIESNTAAGVEKVSETPFTVVGRRILTSQPTRISVYNTVGSLVFEKDVVNAVEIPTSLGYGLFLIKSPKGIQKAFLTE